MAIQNMTTAYLLTLIFIIVYIIFADLVENGGVSKNITLNVRISGIIIVYTLY